jgi:hypothetical protein
LITVANGTGAVSSDLQVEYRESVTDRETTRSFIIFNLQAELLILKLMEKQKVEAKEFHLLPQLTQKIDKEHSQSSHLLG